MFACTCEGKPFPGILLRLETREQWLEERRPQEEVFYFLTGNFSTRKLDEETLKALREILQKEKPFFLALGEEELQREPAYWKTYFAKAAPPLLLTNGAPRELPVRRWIRKRIEGDDFLFLNFVDPSFVTDIRLRGKWELDSLEWTMQILEEDGVFQANPITLVIYHGNPLHAPGLATRYARFWDVLLVPAEKSSRIRREGKVLIRGVDPCGNLEALQLRVLGREVSYSSQRIPLRTEVRKTQRVPLGALSGAPEVSGEPVVVGMQTCAKCHEPYVQDWKQSAHARTVEGGEECARCHAPFRELGDEAISCEACHQNAFSHVFSAQVQRLRPETKITRTAPIQEKTCLRCHGDQRPRDAWHKARFRFVEALRKIRHQVKKP